MGPMTTTVGGLKCNMIWFNSVSHSSPFMMICFRAMGESISLIGLRKMGSDLAEKDLSIYLSNG
jgi:hypothetical protein